MEKSYGGKVGVKLTKRNKLTTNTKTMIPKASLLLSKGSHHSFIPKKYCMSSIVPHYNYYKPKPFVAEEAKSDDVLIQSRENENEAVSSTSSYRNTITTSNNTQNVESRNTNGIRHPWKSGNNITSSSKSHNEVIGWDAVKCRPIYHQSMIQEEFTETTNDNENENEEDFYNQEEQKVEDSNSNRLQEEHLFARNNGCRRRFGTSVHQNNNVNKSTTNVVRRTTTAATWNAKIIKKTYGNKKKRSRLSNKSLSVLERLTSPVQQHRPNIQFKYGDSRSTLDKSIPLLDNNHTEDNISCTEIANNTNHKRMHKNDNYDISSSRRLYARSNINNSFTPSSLDNAHGNDANTGSMNDKNDISTSNILAMTPKDISMNTKTICLLDSDMSKMSMKSNHSSTNNLLVPCGDDLTLQQDIDKEYSFHGSVESRKRVKRIKLNPRPNQEEIRSLCTDTTRNKKVCRPNRNDIINQRLTNDATESSNENGTRNKGTSRRGTATAICHVNQVSSSTSLSVAKAFFEKLDRYELTIA